MIPPRRFLAVALFLPFSSDAALPALKSAVYPWDAHPAQAAAFGQIRPILRGECLDLSELRVDGITLNAGAEQEYAPSKGTEILVIVKEGRLEARLGADAKALGSGGVAYVLPGDRLTVASPTGQASQYFLFHYNARVEGDADRGRQAGGSFLLPWEEVKFDPSERGGYRQQCRRPTCLFNLFEMHTTTLNAGLYNHDVHTHRAEEMVVFRHGKVKMDIDGTTVHAGPGDLMFLEANVPHGLLTTVDDNPTEYFAFQWLLE